MAVIPAKGAPLIFFSLFLLVLTTAKEVVTKTGASSLSVSVTGSSSLFDTKDHKSTAAAASASSSGAATSSATASSSSSSAAAQALARKSKVFPAYATKFTAQHKNAITCARFSADGAYAVTGSADCALKVLEVAKMHYNTQSSKTEKVEPSEQTREMWRSSLFLMVSPVVLWWW